MSNLGDRRSGLERRVRQVRMQFPERRFRQRRDTAFQAFLWAAHVGTTGSRTRS